MGRLVVGQPTTVYVEPLDREIGGLVIDVGPREDVLRGDVVCGVTIALDEQPFGLRSGMSVEIDIR